MKKFLFVALLGAGSLIACNDTSNTVNGVDTSSQAYKDSVNGTTNQSTTPTMGTGTDTSNMNNNTNPTMGTGTDTSHSNNMMSHDSSSSMMKSDSMHK